MPQTNGTGRWDRPAADSALKIISLRINRTRKSYGWQPFGVVGAGTGRDSVMRQAQPGTAMRPNLAGLHQRASSKAKGADMSSAKRGPVAQQEPAKTVEFDGIGAPGYACKLSIGELPGQRKPIRRGVLGRGEPLTQSVKPSIHGQPQSVIAWAEPFPQWTWIE